MQLHSKHTQNVQKNWMWGHTKRSSKEILENNSLVLPRVRNRICLRGSTVPFGKIMATVSEGHETGLHHS
jgi:hypothetical protein